MAETTATEIKLEDIVTVLRAMTEVGAEDPTWARRGRDITLQYEFVVDGEVHAFHTKARGTEWTFAEGALADEECDVILRTAPNVLHEVLLGVTNGREAMLSGQLSMRKAPNHPDLLLMRAMFNRYTKSRERGTLTDLGADLGPGVGES